MGGGGGGGGAGGKRVTLWSRPLFLYKYFGMLDSSSQVEISFRTAEARVGVGVGR